MSILVIGDSKHAAFAEDTGMTAFGPLLSEYGPRDAKAEMREFRGWLDKDPRTLYRAGNLHQSFDEWKRERRERERSERVPSE